MFYYLYENFGINIFGYITARSGAAFFIGFFITVFVMPKFVHWAKFKKANQPIYELAPKNHMSKNHTPTMGGIVFMLSAVVATLLCAKLTNTYILGAIFTIVGFTMIGYIDDISKVSSKSNHAGLSPKAKFRMQVILSFGIALY
ncbi:MAG: phospho-N-acetylmuramoyl-pentapeptide-transferase, partial [Campylobacter sp.]|nr:phospho-N-acetylmuramoyl-pentapeptide-transferase [Campylobacter sp.]